LSTRRCQGDLDICQDLLGLFFEIAFANDCTRHIHGILSPDVDCLCRTCYGDNICVSRVFMQSTGIDVIHQFPGMT